MGIVKRPLFLDRDGVINRKAAPPEYITRIEEFEFLPGTIHTLKQLADVGYELYLITNQAGIARNKMTHSDLMAIHQYLADTLKKESIYIKAVYVCPHGYDDGCECRKPKPGMLLQAAREHNINLSQAVYVGDEEKDRHAAGAVGMRFILVPSEQGLTAALQELLSIP